MLRFKRRALVAMGFAVLVGVVSVFVALDVLPYAFAFPLSQFPTSSVTVISDPPPPDLPGQFSEATLLQDNFFDPGLDPNWRHPTSYDDSSWQASYPVVRQPAWGAPVGMAPPVDFIWGGSPGAGPDANGRYNIPTNPVPQYLFLRKNFCIPINADVNSITAATPLRLQVATTNNVAGVPIPSASVYYNSAPIALGLMGDESGSFYNLPLDPTTVASARLVGLNTLAMRVRDNVDDTRAAVAYSLQFDYNIDPNAITVNSNPNPSVTGETVNFSQVNNGLSGHGPFTFGWDFGDGTTSTDPAPSRVYNTPGTYTVTLVMTDSFGCPSAPVVHIHLVEVPTPTPTNTPTDTPTPTPTYTPMPTPTSTSPPRPSEKDEPGPPPPPPTSTPTATPTPPPSTAYIYKAFAFGADTWTRTSPNAPGVNYIKVEQNGQNFSYTAAQGHGYTGTSDIDGTPNNYGVFSGPEEIYDQLIMPTNRGQIVFRVDVPNGFYRFVAAGGDASNGNRSTTLHIQDGDSGDTITPVSDFVSKAGEYWTVTFDGKVVPPAEGGAPDPTFSPQAESPWLEVTSGYIQVRQIVGPSSGDSYGGQLCLLEIWALPGFETPTPMPTPEVLAVAKLPETGNLDRSPFSILHPLPIVGGIILVLIAGYFLIRRYPGLHN